MKHLLSLFFYYIGDIISQTTMRIGRGYGYPIYSKVMKWSVELDENCRIWKKVGEKEEKEGVGGGRLNREMVDIVEAWK